MMECRREEHYLVLGLSHELRECFVYLSPPTMFPSNHRSMDVLDVGDGVVLESARHDSFLLPCASLLL
jgi:hypothetical protein